MISPSDRISFLDRLTLECGMEEKEAEALYADMIRKAPGVLPPGIKLHPRHLYGISLALSRGESMDAALEELRATLAWVHDPKRLEEGRKFVAEKEKDLNAFLNERQARRRKARATKATAARVVVARIMTRRVTPKARAPRRHVTTTTATTAANRDPDSGEDGPAGPAPVAPHPHVPVPHRHPLEGGRHV